MPKRDDGSKSRSASSDARIAPVWTLGILAGGQSRRFGRDKAELPFLGTSLLDHLARRCAPSGVPVLVATRPDGPGRDAGYPWVADPKPGEGPLAGIAALLSIASTPFVLVTPCDLPLLPPDFGDRLLEHARSVDAVLVSVGAMLQPLPALLSCDLAPLVSRLLDQGARKASAYVDHAACAFVPFERLYPGLDPEVALLNTNTEAELQRAAALAPTLRQR